MGKSYYFHIWFVSEWQINYYKGKQRKMIGMADKQPMWDVKLFLFYFSVSL